jgi:catechol 2,3-dioxygenase-like lactoylglutathione lyase family enzyme
MFAYVCLGTNDLERATRFYDSALAALGLMRRVTRDFDVDHFHAAALAHGGTSEGGPGFRVQYEPDFYAAYVRDPDGNKLAAVYRRFRESQ